MGSRYDDAADRLRAEHQASVHESGAGWRWACTCGREGKGGGTRTPAGAQAAMNRHLQTEYNRLLAAATDAARSGKVT